MKHARKFWLLLLALGSMLTVAITPASAQQQLTGQVLGAGAPIADATVTLWAASTAAPVQLAQTRSDADGRFTLEPGAGGKDATLYLVAKAALQKPPLTRAQAIPSP